MANLQNDLSAAIVATIQAASSRFSVLGLTGATLHVQASDQATRFPAGQNGLRCLVRPLPLIPGDGMDYDESAQSTFRFRLEFEGLDRKSADGAKQVIDQAMHGTFRDRGADMFANFTDNGSNRLGGSGVVRVGQTEDDTDDPDHPKLVAGLEVTMWHRVPLA